MIYLDLNQFRMLLSTADVFTNPSNTANGFAHQLHDTIVSILDKLAPLKVVTKRRSQHVCGWLSENAVELRRHRRTLERRYRRTRKESDRIAYSEACRTANKAINNSRSDYIKEQLACASGDSRQRWQLARKLLHTDRKDNIDKDQQKLCNTLSAFFINKLDTVKQKIASQLGSGLFQVCLHL